MLCESTEKNMLAVMTNARKNSTPEQIHKQADQLMKRGNIRAAVKLLCETEKGGVLGLDEEVKGKTVLQTLKDKHPTTRFPSIEEFQELGKPPDLITTTD